MKKFFKILISTLAILALLLALGIILIKQMLPPEKVKEFLALQVNQKLKRELTLGEIKIGIFSGISIKDFALSESPNFKNGTFVESKNFTLKFQLLPLLQKKVLIDEITLESPKVRIVQNKDGKTFNFSDLVSSSAAAQKTEKTVKESSPDQPIALMLSKAKISKGKIEFVDKSPKKIKIVISPLDINITGTALNKPMLVECSFTLDSLLLGKNLAGTLSTKANLDLPKQSVEIENFKWKMNALTLELKGKIENFQKPLFEISSQIKDLNLKELSPWVVLPKTVELSGSPQIGVNLKGTQEDLESSINLDFSNNSLKFSNLFTKKEGTRFLASLQARLKQNKNLDLQSLNLELANCQTQVQGQILDFSSTNPLLHLKIEIKPFELRECAALSPLAAQYSPQGTIALKAQAEGHLKTLRAKGTLKLENLKAQYEKFIAASLNGSIEFTENSVHIPELKGKLGTSENIFSEFQIKSSVENFLKPELTLTAHLGALDLGMFMTEKKKGAENKEAAQKETTPAPPYKGPEIKAKGKVTIGKIVYTKFEGQNNSFEWNLTKITPLLDKCSGAFKFEMNQGKIKNVPLLNALDPFLKIDPNSFSYSRMGGHWDVQQGTAKTEDMEVLSPSIDLFAKGALHLPTKKPDMTLTAKLPKGSLGGSVGEFSSDKEGRPTFVFKLKNDWKPSLDASHVQKQVVEKAKEEIKKKASDLLQKEGKKLLEGLFK
ncbi:MAG: AsmA family protein [Elusimicrobia bacterium]|nr:AsmA family protein [Elusimicrobiota bacterium]